MVVPLSKEDFNLWLDEPIWGHGAEKYPRRELLWEFASDCIYELDHHKYPVFYKYRSIWPFAKWMYSVYVKKYFIPHLHITFDWPDHRDWPEDKVHFDYVVSSQDEKGFNFMERMQTKWKEVEGFDPDTDIGKSIWEDFTEFLYHIIDIDASIHAQTVEDQLFGGFRSDDSSDEGHWRGGANGRRAQKRANDIYYHELDQGFHRDDKKH